MLWQLTKTAAVTFALTCGAQAQQADWPQQGFDARRANHNPNESLLGPGNVNQLQVSWSNSVPCTINSVPTVVDGIVYYGHYCGEFRAVDEATGRLLWQQTIDTTESGHAVHEGVVYVAARCTYTYCGTLYAFDALTGATLWTWSSADSHVGAPVVADGLVYVYSVNDAGQCTNHAFDALLGVEVWSTTPGGTAAAVDEGVVYVTTQSTPYTLLALDGATGDVLWRGALVLGDRVVAQDVALSRPTVANGFVYVHSNDGLLYAFEANRWLSREATAAPRARRIGVPLIGPSWVGELPGAPTGTTPVSVGEGRVFVGAGNSIHAFDASGCGKFWCSPLWSTGTACTRFGGSQNAPSIANGVLYAGCDNNYLYALDASTGALLWSYYTSGCCTMRSSPSVVDGRLFHAATFNFKLYAFEVPGTEATGAGPRVERARHRSTESRGGSSVGEWRIRPATIGGR